MASTSDRQRRRQRGRVAPPPPPAPVPRTPMPPQARLAGGVIIVAMLGWMAASAIGGALGLPARYAFLIDFAALGAFVWALVVLFQVWRARQPREDG